MVPLRIQRCHVIEFVTVRVSQESYTLGDILFFVIYHRLLFAYKFELIWIKINFKVLDWNHTVFFIIGSINWLFYEIIWCAILSHFEIRFKLFIWVVIIIIGFIISRTTKEFSNSGWSLMRRRTNNRSHSINWEVWCLLFEKYLKFVLRGMQNHGIALIVSTLLSVSGVAIPFWEWLFSLITRGRISCFM
jgi:hypothetical protein